MEPLDHWIERQYRHAADAMQASISPVGIVKTRPGFGQTIRPKAGSIVASPVLASYDPDPDYFFHWYRDGAVVIDTLRLLFEDGSVGTRALQHLADFVRFNLALRDLDGRALAADGAWRAGVAADHARFVRSDAELRAVHGDAVAAETRVNADGTLDISCWTRPQHDGPALRALALLRWMRRNDFEAALASDIRSLLDADLDFVFRHWQAPSFDIWEEEEGQHYYTLSVAAAALDDGANGLEAAGEGRRAARYRAEAQTIRRRLDEFWMPEPRFYRSRVLASGQRSTKELDIAVVLAAIHADHAGAHSARDARAQATLDRLADLFRGAYAINRQRDPGGGPAMGRYAGDVYYAGGAYFFSTLGAAEFCFRAAPGSADPQSWCRRGDDFLETVRAYTPASGDMAEQFDQRTGAPASARHLAWSYAAFISCIVARRALVARR